MTKNERMGTALAIAFFLHFLLLISSFNYDFSSDSNIPSSIELELETSMIESSSESSLNLAEDGLSDEERKMQNERRLAMQTFIKEIQAEIHRHRLNLGNKKLIGIAWYYFQIKNDSSFTNITLEKSSGNALLDKDARNAIQLASKKIKRPKILGNDSLGILIPIKYQYALH